MEENWDIFLDEQTVTDLTKDKEYTKKLEEFLS